MFCFFFNYFFFILDISELRRAEYIALIHKKLGNYSLLQLECLSMHWEQEVLVRNKENSAKEERFVLPYNPYNSDT